MCVFPPGLATIYNTELIFLLTKVETLYSLDHYIFKRNISRKHKIKFYTFRQLQDYLLSVLLHIESSLELICIYIFYFNEKQLRGLEEKDTLFQSTEFYSCNKIPEVINFK